MDSDELQAAYGDVDLASATAARKQYELTRRIRRRTLTAYEKVKAFHLGFLLPVASKPQFLSDDRLALRKRLIEEEYQEFLDAVEEGDLVNAAKELADLIYVVNGTAVEMGYDLDSVFTEVHDSNMSKLNEDGTPIFREDGKVLKGPNYREPDVAKVLGL